MKYCDFLEEIKGLSVEFEKKGMYLLCTFDSKQGKACIDVIDMESRSHLHSMQADVTDISGLYFEIKWLKEFLWSITDRVTSMKFVDSLRGVYDMIKFIQKNMPKRTKIRIESYYLGISVNDPNADMMRLKNGEVLNIIDESTCSIRLGLMYEKTYHY